MKRISPPPLYDPAKIKRFKGEDGKQLKIVSWNCNGLLKYTSKPIDKFTSKVSFLTRFLELHKPDVLCLQEVHVKESERTDLIRTLKLDAVGYTSHLVIPASNHRKAGVLTLYKTECKPRTVDWDHEGRVSVLEFPGFSILNVYALNSTEYDYFHNGVKQGTRAQRKREFDTLLANEMQVPPEVVAIGDFNVSRYDIDVSTTLRVHDSHALNRAHFNATFGKFRDVVRERYPTAHKFSWFGRSRARVDLILASGGIDVIDADVLEQSDRGESDHCPLFVTVRHVE